MQSVNEIKKRITAGSATASKASRDPASLALGEHDGTVWATNRYWLTPAARVAPLLEQFNLSAGEPGSFEVNAAVRKTDSQGFKPGRLIGKLADYPEEATPVTVGDGHEAHVRLTARSAWLAVYRAEGGALFGLPADDLAWLADITGMQLSRPQAFELGPDDHFGEVRVMCKGRASSGPVAVVVDVIRTIRRTAYGTDPATGESVTHLGETENLGPRIIGLLMSVKLES